MGREEMLALPLAVPLPVAGRAWGMGRTKSYELARAGKFPCEVQQQGCRFIVPKPALLAAFGIPWSAVPAARTDAA